MNIFREEVRTGLLVVVTLAALVTLMLYLGSPGVFIPQKSFVVYVDNAAGLKQGAEVALAGRRIGQVIKLHSPVPEAERPDPKKETKIEVKVARSAQIYNNVTVLLTSSGLLGEMFLDFTSGSESTGLATEGATFLGIKPVGLDQAVPLVLAAIDPVVKKATETLDSLQKTSDNFQKLTAEGGEVQQTVAEFRKFGANLNLMAAPGGPLRLSLDNIAAMTAPEGKLQLAFGNIEKLTNETGPLTRTLKNAETFTGNLAGNKDIEATLRNAKKATSELNETIADLRGQFSNITLNLNQASDTVKRQPWRLIWPSTKKYDEALQKSKATPTPKPNPKYRAPTKKERLR